SGSAPSSSSTSIHPDSGSRTATTYTPTRGPRSATPTRRLAPCSRCVPRRRAGCAIARSDAAASAGEKLREQRLEDDGLVTGNRVAGARDLREARVRVLVEHPLGDLRGQDVRVAAAHQ